MTIDEIMRTYPTSLGTMVDADWLHLWRRWVGDRNGLVAKLGGKWAVDDCLGNFPLIETKAEALARVDGLICAEAKHRARLIVEQILRASPSDFTCDRCDDAWPFDPARLVFCPECDASVGRTCKRPSGHVLYGKSHHASREPAAIAAGLLQRCKAAPALQALLDQPALF